MREKIAFVIALSIVGLRPTALAQSWRGTISGVVTDAANKPVAGAQVNLVQEEMNKSRTATSDEQGAFMITLLPPGAYRLEVEKAGFRKHLQNLVLQVNQELRVEVPLLPGQLTEVVVVTASRGLLRTDAPALGGVIENRQILGLPLDGRNFYELTLLLPGTAPAAQGSAGSVRGEFAFSVNGAREDSNSFLLDGVYNGDPKLNTFSVQPPLDAIQEFEVLAHTYDASFGRNTGGQVNVVLKSGANQLHGSVYEFFRNKVFDARNFFALPGEPDPQYHRNQFGASFGGPLRRDRIFFFGDYEGRRLREGITRTANVPTLQERRQIPPALLNPIGLAIAALYPEPNRAGPGYNFVSSPALRERSDSLDARLDHSLGRASELSARYSFSDRDLFEPFSGPGFSRLPGYGTNIPRRAQNVMLGETHVFSPFWINEVRAAFNRVAAGAFHENQGRSVNRKVGLPELSDNPRDHGLSFITVTGFSPLGDEFNNPQHSVTNTFQVLEQATRARGRHLLKLGFDLRAVEQNAFRDVQSRGFLSFLGLSGNALAKLLLGLPTLTGGARLDNHQHLRTESYHFFAQHSYRARPRLTLSAGLRYEYISPPVDTQDRANTYDPARQALARVGTGGIPRSGYANDRNNWAPRLGLAWTLGRQGHTVLRAGYGVYYDESALAPGEGLYFNPPFFDFKVFFPLLPALPLTLQDPFPRFFPLALPSSALAFQRDLRTPYVQHWNAGVQQQLGRTRALELAYLGSKGTKLLTARDINQPRPSLPQPGRPPLRPAPQFDDINLLESRSSSSYHSLQARFEQRLDKGLSLLASYTWSKSLDDASSFFSSAGDPNFPQDSFNVRAERGRSNFDARQRLSLSYSYDLPFGGGRWRGGWQTFGVLTLQTGRPFTVALLPELDNSNTGRSILGFGANDRPHRLRDGQLSRRTPDRWFDTSAFGVQPGAFGNSGRNILDGPGLATLNLSLLKNVALREALSLQIRAEAFNLFNRVNFGLPDIFLGSPNFGNVLSAQNPRRIQLGLKLLF